MCINKFWLFRSLLGNIPGQLVNALVINIVEISKIMDVLLKP